MKTAGKASVGHVEFPALRVGPVLQPMGAIRCHSRPENVSVCPAGRGKETKTKRKRRGRARSQATPQEQFHFSAWLLLAGCVISRAPAAVLRGALLKLPVSLAPWEKPCDGGRGETQAALSPLAALPTTASLHFAFWIRQLSVHLNCPNNNSKSSNNNNNNNDATAKSMQEKCNSSEINCMKEWFKKLLWVIFYWSLCCWHQEENGN